MHTFNDGQIDADHDVIITRFDDLCRIARYANYSRSNRLELMEQLLDYLSTHFEREERIMREADYEDLSLHVAAHHEMQDLFMQLMRPTMEAEPDLEGDLCQMRKMFLSHIVTYDEAFGEWLARQPVLQSADGAPIPATPQ